MDRILLCLFVLYYVFISSVIGQQGYSENSVLRCNNSDDTGPSPAFLYTCNGENTFCRSFLIFKSRPPYTSVISIANLTLSDPSELARLNNVSWLSVFPTDKEVIVPVNCSCSGQYYQANSTYVIPTRDDTYFTIANYTYQGLSSCSSLIDENPYPERGLLPGFELRVPLRCACPSRTQILNGTKYMLTYAVYWGDNVSSISERFNVSQKSVLGANGFSEYNPTLYPFTTILLPLLIEPSSSQTKIQSYTPKPPHNVLPLFPVNSRNHKVKRRLHIRITIAGSSSLLVLVCVVLGVFLFNHKRKLDALNRKKKWVVPEDLLVGIATAERILKLFAIEELKAATNNFSSESKMKRYVYRGLLSGEVVAIKKMNNNVWKEARILNKINHFNLIRLYGVCRDDDYSYLVYEYMENGCLSDWLRSKSGCLVQSWFRRVQIALDVANGLHYLHNFTEPAYVHKDIKSSNVLLNGNLRAKIANFGLARSAENREDGFASSKFVGTRGYMAPEYVACGSVTPKIDVYAFGVVMLELLTGKTAVIVREGKESLLSAAIISIMEGGNAEIELCDYMDPVLGGHYPGDLALAVAKLSVACLMQNPERRPSMDEVVSTLVRIQTESLRCHSSYTE